METKNKKLTSENYRSLLCLISTDELKELLSKYTLEVLAYVNPQILKNNKTIMRATCLNKRLLAGKVCLAAKCDLFGEFYNFADKLGQIRGSCVEESSTSSVKDEVLSVKKKNCKKFINTRRGGYKAKKRRFIKKRKFTK